MKSPAVYIVASHGNGALYIGSTSRDSVLALAIVREGSIPVIPESFCRGSSTSLWIPARNLRE